MKAKIARRARGHVFEDRFVRMTDLQVMIAYRQALREEKEEFEKLKTINRQWSKRFEDFFEALYAFTNPKLFNLVEEQRKLEEHEEEIKVEEFSAIWEDLMKQLPSEIVVDEPQGDPLAGFETIDEETDEIYTGFVRYKFQREGE